MQICYKYIIFVCTFVEKALDSSVSMKQVLRENLYDLVNSLPMSDSCFLAMLDNNISFVGDQKATMLAKDTDCDKASYFLDKIILPGIDTNFIKLLSVMEAYGDTVEILARKIKEELGISKYEHVYRKAAHKVATYM